MKRQHQAFVYAGAAVFLWSTVASAFKLALRGLAVPDLLLVASCSSTLFLLLVAGAQGKLGGVLGQSRTDWARSVLLGLLNPFGYYLVLLYAYDMLPAQEAQPLNYTWPIVLSMLSVPFLKQSLGTRDLGALTVSFCGVIVIATRGTPWRLHFAEPLGCALAVGSSAIWATFWIMNTRDPRDTVSKLLSSFAVGTVLVAGLALVRGGFGAWTGTALAAAVYVGLFEMGAAFVLWSRAMARAERTAAISNLVFLAPFLSLIFIHLIVGEQIRPSSVAGLILIILGIALQKAPRR